MAVSITPAESGLSKVAVLGAGLVGTRVVRELAVGGVRPLTLVTRRQQRVAELRPVAGRNTRIVFEADFASAIDSLDDSTCTVILASEPGGQSELATKCLQRGFHVITCLDEPNVTSELLSLNSLAEANDRRLVVGSAFSPGLTCLLAKWATRHLERVTEIHLARVGAGGPECARQRLRAARGTTMEWRDGSWVPAGSGSGRELCWFPEPIGGRDCYRIATSEPRLLVDAFPELKRATARMAMTRKDRLALPLPATLRAPSEGAVGAARVEVRGFDRALPVHQATTVVLGILDRPDACAAALCAEVVKGLDNSEAPVGAHGLAAWDAPELILSRLRDRGVRVAEFTGVTS